jgi:hypothetical protein
MDFVSEEDLRALRALCRDETPRGVPNVVAQLDATMRMVRAVPALVAEVEAARADLAQQRQSRELLRRRHDRATAELKAARRPAAA